MDELNAYMVYGDGKCQGLVYGYEIHDARLKAVEQFGHLSWFLVVYICSESESEYKINHDTWGKQS